MKKILLAMFAVVSMALAFTSCENKGPEDTTVYCWEVTYSAEVLGITISDTMNLSMTTAEMEELKEEATITEDGLTMEIVSIKKLPGESCLN